MVLTPLDDITRFLEYHRLDTSTTHYMVRFFREKEKSGHLKGKIILQEAGTKNKIILVFGYEKGSTGQAIITPLYNNMQGLEQTMVSPDSDKFIDEEFGIEIEELLEELQKLGKIVGGQELDELVGASFALSRAVGKKQYMINH